MDEKKSGRYPWGADEETKEKAQNAIESVKTAGKNFWESNKVKILAVGGMVVSAAAGWFARGAILDLFAGGADDIVCVESLDIESNDDDEDDD